MLPAPDAWGTDCEKHSEDPESSAVRAEPEEDEDRYGSASGLARFKAQFGCAESNVLLRPYIQAERYLWNLSIRQASYASFRNLPPHLIRSGRPFYKVSQALS